MLTESAKLFGLFVATALAEIVAPGLSRSARA